MLDPENIDTCTVCNERKECNLNNKLTYSSETLQTSLNKYLGPGDFIEVCLDCKSLVDLIEFFSLQLKLKIGELQTLFNDGHGEEKQVDAVPVKQSKKKGTQCCNCGKNFSTRALKKHESTCLETLVETGVKELLETPPVSESALNNEDAYCVIPKFEIAESAKDDEDKDWIPPKVDVKVKEGKKRGRKESATKKKDKDMIPKSDKKVKLAKKKSIKEEKSDKVGMKVKEAKKRGKKGKTDSFLCEYCNRLFKTNYTFENHKRSHTGEKPFQCDSCGATFSHRQNLSTHVRHLHKKVKGYSCEICGKDFSRRRLRDWHVNIKHNLIRAYKCIYCDARFSYPGREKVHSKVCPGLQNMCYRCSKPFSRADLKKHNCRDEDGVTKKGATYIIKVTDATEPDPQLLERMEKARKKNRDKMVYCLPYSKVETDKIEVKPDPDLMAWSPQDEESTKSHKQDISSAKLTSSNAAAGVPNQMEVENAVFSIAQP